MKTKSSWKTTVGGILLAIAPVATHAIPPQFSWISELLAAVGALVLGGSARDHDVSSAAAGVK